MSRAQTAIAGASALVVGAAVLWGVFRDDEEAPPGASRPHENVTGSSNPTAASGLASPSPSLSPEPGPGASSITETPAPSGGPSGGGTPGAGAQGSGAQVASCASPTVSVATAAQLRAALKSPKPGDTIRMEAGDYVGTFSTTASGTKARPITLCGSADAVIDGDGIKGGYGFHLDGARYWVLSGLTVTDAQKGVVADATVGTVIEGLTVHAIGDEGIHLRGFSTDNVIRGNTVYDTGNRREKFGEGIYIGSAHSNWCDVSNCKVDRSDRNTVEHNTIYDTTAESVDIKEGASGGVLRNNSFDGNGLTQSGGDSWVDVKGNDWVIEGNVGIDSLLDGFQVHDVVDGWGQGNVFRDNLATVNGPGYGFAIRSQGTNTVDCSNAVSNAQKGLSNVPCS